MNKDNMQRYEYIINGNEFDTLQEFYKIVDKTFSYPEFGCPCSGLDALVDFLRGGFKHHEYGQPIKITWKNSAKSKKDLGNKFDKIINCINSLNEDDFDCLLILE